MRWYEKSFGALYTLIYRHRSDSQAEAEVAFALETLGLAAGDPVLDLASGNGRHLRALRRAGLRAFGVDLSEPLLASARESGMDVVRADMRAVPFLRRFRAVLSFFTSFGYFETDDENLGVLGEIAGCLQPGGKVLMDLLNRAWLEKNLVPRSEMSRNGHRIVEDRSIDGNRIVKRIHLTGEGLEEKFVESVRLFQPEEIREGLRKAGLDPGKIYGGFEGEEFGPSNQRMIVTATAGGGS